MSRLFSALGDALASAERQSYFATHAPATTEEAVERGFKIGALLAPLYVFAGFVSGSATAFDCAIGGLATITLGLLCWIANRRSDQPDPACLSFAAWIFIGGIVGAVLALPIAGLLILTGVQ